MFFSKMEKLPDGRFLLSAAAAWLLGASVLLCVGSLIANAAGLGERGVAYLCSAVSFLCAVIAGSAASRRSGTNGIVTALLSGSFLVILLLTVGFLIAGRDMDPSSILSLVSFTYAGVLVGILLMPKTVKKPAKRHSFRRN